MRHSLTRHARAASVGVSILSVMAAMGVASAAQAQSCYALSRDRISLETASIRLLADYPATSTIIGACAATAFDTYDYHRSRGMNEDDAGFEAGATFGGCALIGCLFTSYGTCLDVSMRWFEIGLLYHQVDQEMLRLRCPQ